MAFKENKMSSTQLLQDMMRQYCRPSSVYPDIKKKLREVLTQLSDQQKLHILQQDYTTRPLHRAARRDDTEIISTLLTSLQSSADRLKLLMVDDEYTPLHRAALMGHTESVKMILDCLTADQQIQIMSVQDWGDETAIQCAESIRRTDTVRVLREYQHRAESLMKEEYSKLMIIIPLLLIIMAGVMRTLMELTILFLANRYSQWLLTTP